jgi:hypothetical protein
MPEPKTGITEMLVSEYIKTIPEPQVRQDCSTIVDLMQEITKTPPKMWGNSIIGFGQYRIANARGKVSDWPLIAFSPRKQAITFYLGLGGMEDVDTLLANLGTFTIGKGCLYIKHLSDVNLTALKALVQASFTKMLKTKTLV